MSIVISTKELYQSLKNSEELLLVDTRPFTEYSKGHIQSAVNLNLFQFHWLDTSKTGIKQFENQSRILLSNLGVKKSQQVVFYDNLSGMSSARGVWLLLYFSHKNACLLDGGFQQWQTKGYSVETKTNHFSPSVFVGKPNRKILATFKEVKKSVRKKDSVIIDARTKEEYLGRHVRAARAGHIPSAINIDWEKNIEQGLFKTRAELSKIYSKIPKDSKVVTYCQGGYQAAHTFLALKIVGHENVKMYLGSWGEWGNRTELPIEIH